ncbi:hypothetical protein LMH87_001232 [Akanthomyces muscarius]|uniref:Uncharacterized protein n=1 Tax=Akanthomyces muscarius TaxID=2231603 RepID=A0A9W8ULV6_AKAMU|nr:hypothetical protein LMH87_001232 [Akanthomyces muscarius]KAJ4156018.1 hypothetical protein LMH87_001232 [Akanthomyces muscarius]
MAIWHSGKVETRIEHSHHSVDKLREHTSEREHHSGSCSGFACCNCAFPFRQAYTYCVEFNCRYGCILTTEEAFVFRIRPVDPTDKTNTLKNTLRKCGLMEYASIPWSQDGGTIVNKGKHKKNEQPLTFNLAVWFLHVLAAYESEPNWTYNVLKSENLQQHECLHPRVPATPESEKKQRQRPGRSGSRKRAYEDVGESYTHSFTSDSLAFTGSFQSQRSRRSESAPSDTTHRNERTRRFPNGDFATSIKQGDSFASSNNDSETGHTELRRSKRVRAEGFKL